MTEVGALPVEVTSFVGRREELRATRKVLAAARLVTLTGTGGVGKTRLALRAATEVRGSFADGVWLVELAALRDPALLAQTIGAAFRLGDTGGDPSARLVDFLRDKQLLLVLDNCEHLGQALAALVHELLVAVPDLRVLTTSRHVLGLDGEHVLPVPPLAVPPVRDLAGARGLDVVKLFVDRAAAVCAGFTVHSGNWPQVVQICHRLEGIPLAVELAAGWLRVLSVDELLARLDDFFALLRRGSPVVPARHRTLAGTVEWSHELCSSGQRLLWARLGVFAGAFDVTAVERVCAGDGIERDDVLDLLAGLVGSSVVQAERPAGTTRFRLLEPIRQYAQAKLRELGLCDELRDRHRDHYLRLAEQAAHDWGHGPEQALVAARVRADLPNLRAALEHSLAGDPAVGLRLGVALEFLWLFCGHVAEGAHWLERALALNPEPGKDRARALWIVASSLAFRGGREQAVALGREAEAWALEHDDADELAHARLVLGGCAFLGGDVDRADELFHEAEVTADGEVLLQILIAVAHTAVWRDDGDEALAVASRGLALCGEQFSRSGLLGVRGLAHWRLGSFAAAAEDLTAALSSARPFGDVLGAAKALEFLAWTSAALGQPDRAAELLGTASAVWPLVGGRPMYGFGRLIDVHADCVAGIASALGARFRPAYERGAAAVSDLDSAIAFALGSGIPDERPAELSRREYEVARLVADGLSNKDIAERLVISRRTAESHVVHILDKLGFRSRSQIATWITRRAR
ncbi:LuxR C-terminal-related transcriptional regulator [Amycolatopsis sp. NPDC051372]|uniref:ATP-binding protein n=1 Tax=Amycolatopsis sp. NPDC051372 TaxID=3155669 RepID=UPI00343E6C2B